MSSGLTGARFRPRRVLGGSLPRRSPRLMAAILRLDADAILRDAGLLGRLLETSPRPAPGRAGDLREPAVPVPPSRAGRAIKMVRTRANYQNMTKRPDAVDAHDVQYEPLSRPTASAGRIFPCSMNLFDPQIHLKLGYRVESAFFGLSSCDNRRCPRQASATASQIAPSAQRTPARRQVLRSSGDQSARESGSDRASWRSAAAPDGHRLRECTPRPPIGCEPKQHCHHR